VAIGAVSANIGTPLSIYGDCFAIARSYIGLEYTITPSAGSGGSISPDAPLVVNQGATPSFTVTPDTNYHILDVQVDSVSVLGDLVAGVYTFPEVTVDHTIVASFAPDL